MNIRFVPSLAEAKSTGDARPLATDCSSIRTGPLPIRGSKGVGVGVAVGVGVEVGVDVAVAVAVGVGEAAADTETLPFIIRP